MKSRLLFIAALFFLTSPAAHAQRTVFVPIGGNSWGGAWGGGWGGSWGGTWGGGAWGGGMWGNRSFAPWSGAGWGAYSSAYAGFNPYSFYNAGYGLPYSANQEFRSTPMTFAVYKAAEPRMRSCVYPAVAPPCCDVIRAALDDKGP